jgi:hypothetical protein
MKMLAAIEEKAEEEAEPMKTEQETTIRPEK